MKVAERVLKATTRRSRRKPTDLDTIRPGFSLSDSVRVAVDNTEQRLVTCVLNTIDDALDRSDPAGTLWSTDAVKHLRPLLDRARKAGRTVVITSDHGHVVERRQGTPRMYAGVVGPTRHRPVIGDVEPDEVLVRGDRVLTSDNAEILAVSERLRYGPLKAGYHGGAAPAEVIVPLVVLVPIVLAQGSLDHLGRTAGAELVVRRPSHSPRRQAYPNASLVVSHPDPV